MSYELKKQAEIARWMDASKKLYRWKCMEDVRTINHHNLMNKVKRQQQREDIIIVLGCITVIAIGSYAIRIWRKGTWRW